MLAGLASALAFSAAACTSDQEPATGRTPGAGATLVARIATTATPSPRPAATRVPPTPTPDLSGIQELPGLDPTPRETKPAAVRTLGPVPPPLPSSAQDVTVLYDLAARRAVELGPGTYGFFSPDSRFMAWSTLIEPEQVWVIDLQTHEKWTLGQGSLPRFVDPRTVRANVRDPQTRRSHQELIDILTGNRRTQPEPTATSSPPFHPFSTYLSSFPLKERGSRVTLRDSVTDGELFWFDALFVEQSSDSELLVATMPVENKTNIYLLSLPKGVTTYLGTTDLGFLQTIEITATDRYVVWDAYCSKSPIGLYDRRTGTVTEIISESQHVTHFVRVLSNNLLGFGSFGPDALVDPVTLEYVFAVPSWDPATGGGIGDVHWSPDYRFASQGRWLGHGGLCG